MIWILSFHKSVFNKAGKHLSHKFVFQNNNLECVSRYKYLGIWFNIPSADLDNKTMSSAYIKQWIGELSKMTGSFVLLR
jgi:hypothetical protein